jgi:polynucleotide 5'-kinase involved in rRNA processing
MKQSEYMKNWNKKYYAKNRKKELARRKKYHLENKEAVHQRSKQERIKNREKNLIKDYKAHDRKMGLHEDFVCDLTIDWMKENITSKPCTYCGYTEKISCDRIDNTKGHTKGNCIPSCFVCNDVRGKIFSVEETLMIGKVIKQIRENRVLIFNNRGI